MTWINSKIRNPYLLGVVIWTLWALVSALGVLGMFWQLYWTRDRVLYSGTPVHQQRAIIFERAGLDESWLEPAERAEHEWPKDAVYTLSADQNTTSYISFILSPRLIKKTGTGSSPIELRRSLEKPLVFDEKPKDHYWLAGIAWLSSVLLVLGIGLLRPLTKENVFWPETLAWGVGGSTMCLLFFRVALGWGMGGTVCLWILAGIAGWARFLIYAYSPKKKNPSFHTVTLPHGLRFCNLCVLGCIGISSVILAWLMATVVVPDDWDAWAIWGSKAKFLTFNEGSFKGVTHFGHPDYPLMWPSIWALNAWLSGGWEEQWVRGWSALCLLFSGGAIYGTLRTCRVSLKCAVLGAVFFMCIPKVIVVSSWSYAEPFLWLLMTCSFGRILRFHDTRSFKDAGWAIMWGIFAAHVKNEGLLYFMLSMGWFGLYSPGNLRFRIFLFSAALISLVYFPWFYWIKIDQQLGSHALEGLKISRVAEISKRIIPGMLVAGHIWLDLKQWGISLWLLIGATLWFWITSFRRSCGISALPLIYLAALFAIEVTHTADLQWQISTSWDRLTIQALPLWIMSVFVLLFKIPEVDISNDHSS